MSRGGTRRNRVGELVAERYRLDRLIDSGGQSFVYAATDVKDGDEVAVKVVIDAKSRDTAYRERVFREARAMTQLWGTAAVRVLDQRFTDDGAFCLVMEFLRGKNFENYLLELEQHGAHLLTSRLLELLEPVVATLEKAHSLGILHRDLKPGNIFVLEGGGVRLLDFGFAKFQRMPSVTQTGWIAGSPSYIAPELWKSLDGRPYDQRIDVYSLTAVVFRSLSGQVPFPHRGLDELLPAVTSGPRPSLHRLRPDLPPLIDHWVAQGLAIEPEERFTTVRGLWNALCVSIGRPNRSSLPPGLGY